MFLYFCSSFSISAILLSMRSIVDSSDEDVAHTTISASARQKSFILLLDENQLKSRSGITSITMSTTTVYLAANVEAELEDLRQRRGHFSLGLVLGTYDNGGRTVHALRCAGGVRGQSGEDGHGAPGRVVGGR